MERKQAREAYLRRKYGIGIDEYEAILRAQGGVCAVCKQTPAEGKSLNVDHDHNSGIVTGLLDPYCNRYRVGRQTDARLARAIADYLESPPATIIGFFKVPRGRRGRNKT